MPHLELLLKLTETGTPLGAIATGRPAGFPRCIVAQAHPESDPAEPEEFAILPSSISNLPFIRQIGF
jgi:hypothetical protein